jgi:hypothetical protein
MNMAESNINCKHINELNCNSFDENRLCPDDCISFIAKDGIIYEVNIDKKESSEQVYEKRSKK